MSFYRFARSIVAAVVFPLFRIKVIGKENIPEEGPVIICSNHISNFDPLVVGITAPRDIYFLAKEELFNNAFFKEILLKVHAFPIKRGMKDRNALRQGLGILKEGNVLGLFPEGTRSKTGKIGKGLAGAGFFALRSEATIVPCVIIGPYKLFQPLLVIYGKPLDMDYYRKNKVPAKEVTEVIMSEIRAVLEKHQEE